MKRSRRSPHTWDITVEEIEVGDEFKAEKYLAVADKVFGFTYKGSPDQPPTAAVYRKARVVMVVGGENIPLEGARPILDAVFEQFYGIQLETVAEALNEVEVEKFGSWRGIILGVEEVERFEGRLQLLADFEEEIRVPKSPA